MLTTILAERFRVRHELSGANFNNFNVEYWVGRFGYYEIRDYTRSGASSQRQSACGTSDPCVVVDVFGAIPVAMTDSGGNEKSCNQQTPNFRYDKVFGDETNFRFGYVMDIVLDNGNVVAACSASRDQRANATHWRALIRPDQNLAVTVAEGNQIEFELTISFNRAQTTGDNVNYYGHTFKYVLGQGFTNNNRDSSLGPTNINDSFAKLGGGTTVPHLSNTGNDERRLSFMQHAYNMGPNNIEDWLIGRRIFHTDFSNGNHIEQLLPGPQAQNGNLSFPGLANKATNAIQNSCIDCHFVNGPGTVQNTQSTIPPKMIGLGLLEAIPDSTIEGWSQANGGRINRVNNEIGRFGWDAGTATVEDQVVEALANDMGVTTSEITAEQLDQLVVYSSLISVPTPRANLTQMPGHQRFQDWGCDDCHIMTTTTGNSRFAELANQTIHPYTDLLLHNLGDGDFRTAPLWGIGYSGFVATGNFSNFRLMHDGNSTSIDDAIQRHNGDAVSSKNAYNNANNTGRQELIDYLNAL